ncbi:MAG TPA: hypothetical protein VK179_07205 [Bacteroidales bacterium]|nr:hypothetical protein [Bacteroidales bacterium]
MKKSFCLLILVCTGLFGCKQTGGIDLSGKWSFKTDPGSKGIQEKWYNSRFEETVLLPGSMATNIKGDDISVKTEWTGQIVDSSWFTSPEYEKYRKAGQIKIPFWLQLNKHYVGMAWYQKEITIPNNWKGKYIQLFLERCHWETSVWVDGKWTGTLNSLGTPHIYDLTEYLTPGKHSITILVDNRIKDINVGQNSHSISDHTQTNWNGIAGKIELQSKPLLHIVNIKVFPDLKKKLIRVKVTVENTAEIEQKATITLLAVTEQGISPEKLNSESTEIFIKGRSAEYDLEYPMGNEPMLWDEFNPNLYRLKVSVENVKKETDSQEVLFGMREIRVNGKQIVVNEKPVFFRGTLECAIFPRTGYPPTDTAEWMRIFRIARSYGLNLMRFHSWCPPDAAFEAADRTGFYLHVECSSWANQGTSIGNGLPVDQFIYDESERMVNAYGNHPSFCMLLYGNEPDGKNMNTWLGSFIDHWKSKDLRRIYSGGAGWPIIPENDFNNVPEPRIQGWGQGLNSIINAQPPKTDYDWRDKISATKPTISHEIGQWCAYPDFKEISQYTGVLKPENFEIFRETLEKNNMGSLADSFLLASGKLQVLCYKADIEAALRTPGFGGFELLDLHDFPGQGTALVGVLNAFWNSKGYVTPGEYRRFCNSTVPLVRLPKLIYTDGDSLIASLEIAHFGKAPLKQMIPSWKLTAEGGEPIADGKLPATDIPIGSSYWLGAIHIQLRGFEKPQKLTLTLSAGEYENSWPVWVYPGKQQEIRDNILVTQSLDQKAVDVLNHGGKVLLTIKKGSIKPEQGGDVAVGFSSIFWNTAWTSNQAPHTLGILCNPKHPAFNEFPTDFYSDYQWWDAMSHSNALLLSDLPPGLKPIVRVIDTWFRNRPLALLFEARIGKGKIIVSGIDLITDSGKRPESRQFLYSLKKYMSSSDFNPSVKINIEDVQRKFLNLD